MQSYAILFALLIFSDFISTQLKLNIPGSILGLVLLFSYFCFKGQVNENLEASSKTLLKFLPLFLVPIGVGVKTLLENADTALLTLVGVSITALICGIIITILITKTLNHLLFKRNKTFYPTTCNLNTKGE